MLDIEVLSPAGNTECLTAALNSGADAVYLGAKSFSARGNADNFDYNDLVNSIKLAHSYTAKVYLAINTLIFDNEIEKVKELITFAGKNGVDAIITQDLAIPELLNQSGYNIPLHASTQMSINSVYGAQAVKKLGFARVVLARELSLDEIREIIKNCDIETEVFIHGALCTSISGQCYMSAFFGGRSGNRGLCAQPCRLEFLSGENKNALSLKDLSLISEINSLYEAGVKSVKIEGRMKRPEYVAAVTNACFKAKRYIEMTEDEKENLKSVFSRSGFTNGYFDGSFNNMSGIRTKNDVIASDKVLSDLRKLYEKPVKRYIIDISIIIKKGERIYSRVEAGGKKLEILHNPPESAKSKPTEAADIIKQLRKLGGTIFEAGKTECEIESELYLSVSSINAIRRKIIGEITAYLTNA